jgi:hypothetical protein
MKVAITSSNARFNWACCSRPSCPGIVPPYHSTSVNGNRWSKSRPNSGGPAMNLVHYTQGIDNQACPRDAGRVRLAIVDTPVLHLLSPT